MTKEAIQKARALFGDNQIRVICDNMLIYYDNTKGGVNLIWNDEDETFTAMRATTSTDYTADTCPLEVTVTNYELIQYMEGHLDQKSSMDFAKSMKSKMPTEQYDKLLNLIGDSVRALKTKVIYD